MILRILGILTVCLFAGSVAYAGSSEEELSLILAADRASYEAGETIWCTLVLRNETDSTLTVNERLLLNYDETFPHEILFHIHDPEGNQLELVPLVKAGPLSEGDFRMLAPGDLVLKTVELSRYFAFSREGQYLIRAVYENYVQPEAVRAWTGRVESNQIKIGVRP